MSQSREVSEGFRDQGTLPSMGEDPVTVDIQDDSELWRIINFHEGNDSDGGDHLDQDTYHETALPASSTQPASHAAPNRLYESHHTSVAQQLVTRDTSAQLRPVALRRLLPRPDDYHEQQGATNYFDVRQVDSQQGRTTSLAMGEHITSYEDIRPAFVNEGPIFSTDTSNDGSVTHTLFCSTRGSVRTCKIAIKVKNLTRKQQETLTYFACSPECETVLRFTDPDRVIRILCADSDGEELPHLLKDLGKGSGSDRSCKYHIAKQRSGKESLDISQQRSVSDTET